METKKALPAGWKIVSLGNACKIIMGQSPPASSYNTVGEGLPFFQGKAEFTDLHPVVEKWCNAPNKIAEPNDILLSVRAPVGSTNIADQQCCIGRGLAAIRFENYMYAFYFLRSKKQELDSKGTGTTFKAISGETLRETLFPLPPADTQKAIVAKIEALFSEIDKGMETLRTAQQQLKVYRQSVLKWAFEGKLTNADVKERELPAGWKMTSVGDISKIGTGATPLKSNSKFYGGGIPWVTSGALNDLYVTAATDFVTDQALKETNLTVYPKGTLLVAMYGEGKTRGKCSELLIDACTNQAIAAVRFDESNSSIKPYLKFFLLKNYDDVRRKSSGGVQPNLNLGIIKNLQFPLAPGKEQVRIVQEIENRLSVADKIAESIAQSLAQAEALKQSILKKAFEGELLGLPAVAIAARQIQLPLPALEDSFQRKVFAAYIISQCYNGGHFGKVVFQKTLHLAEYHCQCNYEMHYLQKAAGPLDEFINRLAVEAADKDWFTTHQKQKGNQVRFEPGTKMPELVLEFQQTFVAEKAALNQVLQLLKNETLDGSELYATVYAVWNNCIIRGVKPTEERIVEGVYKWSDRKVKFSEEQIQSAVNALDKSGVKPKGFGKEILKEKA